MQQLLDAGILGDLSEAVLPLLGAVCGYLASKLHDARKKDKAAAEALQKRQAATDRGLKSLLRGQIIDDGLRYLTEGSIPPFALETLEDQYSTYVDLGDGDRGVHDIVRQCRTLQIRSGAE